MSVFSNPAERSAAQAAGYTDAVLALLGTRDPFAVLDETVPALERAVQGLSPRQFTQPEAEGKWSVRHVLQHLADSEVVWAWRLRLVLAQDRPPLTGYDQDKWADRLGYADIDPRDSVAMFSILRRGNLRLVEGASRDDLQRVGVHVERGEESLAHQLKLYAGHDILHLNQLERIRTAIG